MKEHSAFKTIFPWLLDQSHGNTEDVWSEKRGSTLLSSVLTVWCCTGLYSTMRCNDMAYIALCSTDGVWHLPSMSGNLVLYAPKVGLGSRAAASSVLVLVPVSSSPPSSSGSSSSPSSSLEISKPTSSFSSLLISSPSSCLRLARSWMMRPLSAETQANG